MQQICNELLLQSALVKTPDNLYSSSYSVVSVSFAFMATHTTYFNGKLLVKLFARDCLADYNSNKAKTNSFTWRHSNPYQALVTSRNLCVELSNL